MLFEYALNNDSKEIVHVDDVPNGKRCNCICKNCGDALIAKNNGKIIQHHFSHTTKEESRDCKMTQLHMAMQKHFSSLSEITLPPHEETIDESNIFSPSITIKINESAIEYRIGPYLADVYLITNIGNIAIEVCVTHECSEEKEQYYHAQKVDSIEYYFSLAEGRSIAEWISMLTDNIVEHKWIYYSALEAKKSQHFKLIEQEEEKKKIKRKRKALISMRNSIYNKIIHLPSIHKEMECVYCGQTYKELRLIYAKRNYSCDQVSLHIESKDYAVIEAYRGNRVVSIIYSFNEEIPILDFQDERSIVCRHYSKESDVPVWSWVKHPSIEAKFNEINLHFIAECKREHYKREKLLHLKNEVIKHAAEYSENYQNYFDRDYKKWKKWMMKNKLFASTPNKKNPSFPSILRRKSEYPMLWPFKAWDILILSTLAEMVDAHLVNQKISYRDLFLELMAEYGLSDQYRHLLKNFKELNTSTTFDSLITEEGIIREALSPFSTMSIITVKSEYLIRNSSLMSSLSN
ncbi:hypothetical protein [Pantoea sp. SO10]|uniref:hypothetical protein n=1 Tax=Pantoea sp. SO10 TaxID=2575375 RepID=UPI0010C9959A|nr:hypothetical protein [Pantoea sp. SO10]QCP60795.1 hypothetical protein FCN45_16005 [Pantoea sp. SO10]